MGRDTNQLKVKTVKRETLSEKIITEIKALIDSGQITPGSCLPSEREFSSMLGVSRPSLREALKALAVLGIIVNRHGEGNFLAEDHDDWPTEPLSIFFSLKKGALIDIYEARKGLEKQTVALAAERRTLEDLNVMKTALDNMKKSLGDFDRFYKYDLKFHLSIAAATRNPIIIDLMEKIHKISLTTRENLWKAAGSIEVDLKLDLKKHETLLNFIAAGHPEEASDYVGAHLDEILARLKRGVLRGKEENNSDS